MLVSAVLAALLVLAGCAKDVDDAAGAASSGSSTTTGPQVAPSGGAILVLPPADVLSGPARAELRALVESTVAGSEDGAGGWELLEPATAASLADTVEIAMRRTGGDGTVCVVGTRGRAVLGPSFARYPATRACVVPGPVPAGVAEERVAVGDVDLSRLGRELGVVARAAAADGAVLLLDGGDGMLDVRWRRGVEEGVLGAAGGSGPTLGVVTTAAEAVALLDAQAALIAEGIVPGGQVTAEPGGDGSTIPDARDGLPPGDLLPTARALLPVAVVVLDAGPESSTLATVLAERDIPVILPTVLLDAGAVGPDQVVLQWRVRWDDALVAALDGRTAAEAPFVLVPGPASARR